MFETWLWIGDVHCPFEDQRAMEAVMQFAAHLGPDAVVMGGDWIDNYGISDFDRSPDRIYRLEDELIHYDHWAEYLRDTVPLADLHFTVGNHELRHRRLIGRNPALYQLRGFTLPELLNCKKYHITFHERMGFAHKEFVFKHGDLCGKYPAEKELSREGVSGMSGHVHRLQSHYRTHRFETIVWHCNGHLADITKIDYAKDKVNDMQQGIAVVEFFQTSRRFHVTPIPIVEGKFVYQGQLFQ